MCIYMIFWCPARKAGGKGGGGDGLMVSRKPVTTLQLLLQTQHAKQHGRHKINQHQNIDVEPAKVKVAYKYRSRPNLCII